MIPTQTRCTDNEMRHAIKMLKAGLDGKVVEWLRPDGTWEVYNFPRYDPRPYNQIYRVKEKESPED